MANDGFQSNINPQVFATEYRRLQFIIESMLAGVRTSLPCRVESVTNAGGVAPIGFVNIKPLIQQVDGNGNLFDHGIIYNVPYMRIQGGNNAVIIDPQVGDIGMFSVADRDISGLKNTKANSAPASNRKFDMSDAIYHYSIIAETPTQYIQFNNSGITIHSPNAVNITAQVINATATTQANVTAPDIRIGATGQTLTSLVTSAMQTLFNNHVHPNPEGGNTGVPTVAMGAGQLTTTIKGG